MPASAGLSCCCHHSSRVWNTFQWISPHHRLLCSCCCE